MEEVAEEFGAKAETIVFLDHFRELSRVSETLCKQVSVSLLFEGDSHDDEYDNNPGAA